MKLDKRLTQILVCESCEKEVSEWTRAYSNVCPYCGHYSHNTMMNTTTIVGKWYRPSLLEWLKGKRKRFVSGYHLKLLERLQNNPPHEEQKDGQPAP